MKQINKRNVTAFGNVDLPAGLDLFEVADAKELEEMVGKATMQGNRLSVVRGSIAVQGNRLQFMGGLSIGNYLDLVQDPAETVAAPRAGVAEVEMASNRPTMMPHLTKTMNYLKETACIGAKFILPGFILNYGVAQKAKDDFGNLEAIDHIQMYIIGEFAADMVANGVLIVPSSVRLPTTDGAHRTRALLKLTNASTKGIDNVQREQLLRNAVSVVIVFDDNQSDVHQDFADCGQSKPISKSLTLTYGARDVVSNINSEMCKSEPFLAKFVDATASGVNSSGKNPKLFSAETMRGFVDYVYERATDAEREENHFAECLGEFWSEVGSTVDAYSSLSAQMNDDGKTDANMPEVRKALGTSALYRHTAGGLFARVYEHFKNEGEYLNGFLRAINDMNLCLLKEGTDMTMFAKIKKGDAPMDMAEFLETNGNPLTVPFYKVKANGASLSSNSLALDAVFHSMLDIAAEAGVVLPSNSGNESKAA